MFYLKEDIEGMNMVLEIHVMHFEDLLQYQNVKHIYIYINNLCIIEDKQDKSTILSFAFVGF